MAQPLEVEGAMKCALRPFGRMVSDFLTPSTRTLRLIAASPRRALVAVQAGDVPVRGDGDALGVGMLARISRPRG